MTLKNLRKEFLSQFDGRKRDLEVAEKLAGLSFKKLVAEARANYHEAMEEQAGCGTTGDETWEKNAGIHKQVFFISQALPHYYSNLHTLMCLAYRLTKKGFLVSVETTGNETHGWAFKATVSYRGPGFNGRLAWEVSNSPASALARALLRGVENYNGLRRKS